MTLSQREDVRPLVKELYTKLDPMHTLQFIGAIKSLKSPHLQKTQEGKFSWED